MDTDNKELKKISILNELQSHLNEIGTFVQNRMTVAHVWSDNKIIQIYTLEDENCFSNAIGSLNALFRCAMLCNKAEFKQDADNLNKPVLQRETIGDQTESALLRCCELSVGNVAAYRERNPKVFEIPYSASNRYRLSVHQTKDDDDERHLLMMKGAPDRILERCSTIHIDGSDVELTDYWKSQFEKSYWELGGLGEVVLGFCDLRLDAIKYPQSCKFDTEEQKNDLPSKDLRF